jgi:hypothetical protein
MEHPARQAAGARATGIALVSAGTILAELVLTRILSVCLWYHVAFMVLTVALLGLAAGGMLAQISARRAGSPAVLREPGLLAPAAGLLAVAGLASAMGLPLKPELVPGSLAALAMTLALLIGAFALVGLTLSVALTADPERFGRLYAADLVGAATGGVAFLPLIATTDGPSAMIAAGLLWSLGGACLAAGPRAGRGAAVVAVALAALVVVQAGHRPFRPRYQRGERLDPAAVAWEAWDPLGYVMVTRKVGVPFGWGLSPRFRGDPRTEEYLLMIDGAAGSPIPAVPRRDADLEVYRHDVTSLVHAAATGGHLLVIGVGGGRDVRAGLALGRARVTGVEINGTVLELLTGVFREFTGGLAGLDSVRLVHDEARSWLRRSRDVFDAIQVSLVDTWAASSQGAYALAENRLYTREAFALFLERLAAGGQLAVSRWHDYRAPAETTRLVVLAATALAQRGIASPRRHMFLAASPAAADGRGVCTLLVSRDPFPSATVAALTTRCHALGFTPLVAPGGGRWNELCQALDGDLALFVAKHPFDVSPPGDDRPFFFCLLRPADFSRVALTGTPDWPFAVPIAMLLALIVGVALAVALGVSVVAALCATPARAVALTYFGAIGLGFMLVEVALMQRLAVFLGHVSLGLGVGLTTLLVATGAGSWISSRLPGAAAAAGPRRSLALVLALLAGTLGAVGPVCHAFEGADTPSRCALAALFLAPLGLAMGVPFPSGIARAARTAGAPLPLYWAVNSGASVLGSALAMLISLAAGLSACLAAGLAAYAVAWCAADSL